jgi:hypothetical protein
VRFTPSVLHEQSAFVAVGSLGKPASEANNGSAIDFALEAVLADPETIGAALGTVAAIPSDASGVVSSGAGVLASSSSRDSTPESAPGCRISNAPVESAKALPELNGMLSEEWEVATSPLEATDGAALKVAAGVASGAALAVCAEVSAVLLSAVAVTVAEGAALDGSVVVATPQPAITSNAQPKLESQRSVVQAFASEQTTAVCVHCSALQASMVQALLSAQSESDKHVLTLTCTSAPSQRPHVSHT